MAFNKSTGMWEGFIYMIENDINDLKYIGQTIKTVKERWASHKSCVNIEKYNKQYPIYYAMSKYGINHFYISLLQKYECDNLEELRVQLNNAEIYYINKYNTVRPNGYNISTGGNWSPIISKEIYQYDNNCNLLNVYKNAKEASEKTGIGISSIQKCCTQEHKSAGGYLFLYKNMIPYAFRLNNRPVNQYLNGILINTYTSIKEAGNALNIDIPSITNCCKHKRYKSVGGFQWFYVDDVNQPIQQII